MLAQPDDAAIIDVHMHVGRGAPGVPDPAWEPADGRVRPEEVWPEAISLAVEGVDSAPFPTPAQKRANFHDNAAHFLRLAPAGAR